MIDKKNSEPDPDIIPPERKQRAREKPEGQTINTQARRPVTSVFVLIALLAILLSAVLIRFDILSFPSLGLSAKVNDDRQTDTVSTPMQEPQIIASPPAPMSGADPDPTPDAVPAETPDPAPSDVLGQVPDAALETELDTPDASEQIEVDTEEALPLIAPTPRTEATSDLTPNPVMPNVDTTLRQALLLLRAGEALTPLWDDLQRVLPASLLDPMRDYYDEPAQARDALMLAIGDWWSSRQPADAPRLDTGLPAVIDSLLNSVVTVRPRGGRDAMAATFQRLVARGDIAGALDQWPQLSASDQQSLSPWRRDAQVYLARQALIRAIRERN